MAGSVNKVILIGNLGAGPIIGAPRASTSMTSTSPSPSGAGRSSRKGRASSPTESTMRRTARELGAHS